MHCCNETCSWVSAIFTFIGTWVQRFNSNVFLDSDLSQEPIFSEAEQILTKKESINNTNTCTIVSVTQEFERHVEHITQFPDAWWLT